MITKDNIFLWIKLTLSVGILGYLSTKLDWADFYEHISHLTWLEVTIFLILAIGVLAMGAKRWQAVTHLMGHPISFSYLFQANLVGHALSQCLPSSVGGDFYRAYATNQTGMPLPTAVLSTLADRLFGFFGLGALVLIALPFEWGQLSTTLLFWPVLLILCGILGLMIALVALPFLPQQLFQLPIIKLGQPLVQLSNSLRESKHLGSVAAYTILTSAGLIFELYYLNLALELNLSPTLMFLAMPLVFMFMSLPISFAGWGLREGAMIVVLGVYDIPRETALLLSLIYGVLIFATALPGLVLWFWKLRSKQLPA